MLQNAYLLAKIGADTAENERTFTEFLPKTGKYPTAPGRAEVLVRRGLARRLERSNYLNTSQIVR